MEVQNTNCALLQYKCACNYTISVFIHGHILYYYTQERIAAPIHLLIHNNSLPIVEPKITKVESNIHILPKRFWDITGRKLRKDLPTIFYSKKVHQSRSDSSKWNVIIHTKCSSLSPLECNTRQLLPIFPQ